MRSRAHWVEIDLLRRGVSLPLRKRIRPHEYFVHVSPVQLRRPVGWVWPDPSSLSQAARRSIRDPAPSAAMATLGSTSRMCSTLPTIMRAIVT